MSCLNCSSSESSTLVDLRGMSDEQPQDFTNYFKQCKQIKIEDAENAKICVDCVQQLKSADHTGEREKQEFNFDINCIIKTEQDQIKSETTPYQIIWPRPEIKTEPELHIEEDVMVGKSIHSTGNKHL
jgi:hypothetical protein